MPTTAAGSNVVAATVLVRSSATAARALLTRRHATGGVTSRKALRETCGLGAKMVMFVTSVRSAD
jgi:hypothetical protein